MAKKARRKAAPIVQIEGNVSPAFKRAMLRKIAGHVLAVHDKPVKRKAKPVKRVRVKVRVKRKPAKPPVKLSKQLAKVRDAIRRGRGVPMSGDVGSIVIIGERDGYGWLVENQRTGKRVSKHKTFKAAWASQLKALKAERSTIAHELTHGRTPYHNEDPD